MAQITPENLSLVEFHDAFTICEIIHYEGLGVCPLGEGGRLIEDGATEIGGRIPDLEFTEEYFFSVKGASHQRTACDTFKSELFGNIGPVAKLIRGDVTIHWKVFFGRLQILAEGQKPAINGSQVNQGLANLLVCFADTEHKA